MGFSDKTASESGDPIVSSLKKLPRRAKSTWCRLCEKLILARTRKAHVWRSHVGINVFKCASCDYSSDWKGCVQKHIAEFHEGENTEISYERENTEISDEERLRLALAECFG